MIELITSNSVLLLTLISVLAFLVSIITEVTKGIGVLSKIPTNLQVLVVSLILCVLTYLSYAKYTQIDVIWIYIFASIVISFIVAFVAMYGWDKLTEIYNRLKK